MTKPNIILIGAGGHAHSCIDVIEQQNKYHIAGLVGMPHEMHDNHLGYQVIATDDDLPELFKQYKHALVTVGQIKSPVIRVQLFQRLFGLGFTMPIVISPLAYVSRHAVVGDGTIVMHGALINAGARVGINCIINTNALVEHDAAVGDHCHISTGSIVNGGTIIQQKTFIGSNAMISNNIEVGENNIVKGGGGSRSPVAFNSKPLTLGYFADGPWAHQAFDRLFDDKSLHIAFVCARNDKPDEVLKEKTLKNGIDFLIHPKINSDEFYTTIKQYSCDLFVSMSFNQIFKRRLIDIPPQGTINCHAGKLPFYRGRNILNWALINDEPEFGITVHSMDEGIDTGDIILQQSHPISDNDNYATLLERAYEGCASLLYDAVRQIQNGTSKRIPQDFIHPLGMYCPARMAGDEELEWSQSSRSIFNFIRAICKPGPQARTRLNGSEILINKVIWMPQAPHYKGVAGAVLQRDEMGFIVKTLDSYVRVVEWSSDVKIKVGDRLG